MFPGATVLKTHHPIYDIFNTENFDPESVRKTYGIEGHIILFFGFVRGYKGLKYLIDALPKVLSKINVTLLVVGEFWNNKRPYIRQIEDYGLSEHITLIDEYVPNEDIGKYFNAADLVVQPYISATGSGVVQTAFGFNKPVIATTVGSLPEVIEDGKTGYLVSPGNSDELAKAILKFFTERKCREFSRNIQNQSNRFSWDKMVDLIESSIHSPCAYFEKTWSHNA
jgi:glycosyltransferase involved in cell wall biosynthesis